MVIQVLFPEIANLYGDLQNCDYLKRAEISEKGGEKVEIIETHLTDPDIFDVKADLIYMGTMSEDSQKIVIDTLRPYTDKIKSLIEQGQHFLITGNALEIFGKRIEYATGEVVNCLGIFPYFSKLDFTNRFNSLYVGKYGEIDIVGFKSQFSHSYYEEEITPLFKTVRAIGFNPDTMDEGIHVNNFMATYIIGPLTILNPPFTKALLSELGAERTDLAFEEDCVKAYEVRLNEYMEPGRGIYYH